MSPDRPSRAGSKAGAPRRPGVGPGGGARGYALRDVDPADIPILFEQQSDPEICRQAGVPSRTRPAFTERWLSILDSDDIIKKAILFEGAVAGHIVCFDRDGKRMVGYWLGKAFWGRGLATSALAQLLRETTARPLHANVAASNVASIRVLEKCGFIIVSRHREFNEARGEEIEDLLLRLA